MKFYSAAGMQSVDRETIASGVSGEILMARAGFALAGEFRFFADAEPRPLRVLCGPGNNGGDGFALALHLHAEGWPLELWLCVPEPKIRGDAAIFFQRAKAEGIRCRDFSMNEAWERAVFFLPPGAWLVDALLGTGTREAPRGNLAAAVEFLRRARERHPVWSVDVPSGLDPDRGVPFDENRCVTADHTLTLGGPKTGFLNDASDAWTGSVSVLDLGFEAEVLEKNAQTGPIHCLSDRELREALPAPDRKDHKGTRGHLLLVGGSPGMTGAISLSARAALRSGCGLVTVLTPESCAPVVDAAVPEAMVIHGEEGSWKSLAPQEIDTRRFRAVAAGPGMRVNLDSSQLLRRILCQCEGPLILDADAINSLAEPDFGHWKTRAPLWLTPHPGEMARLLGREPSDVQANRPEAVSFAAEKYNARVLLKGARSRMAGKPEDSQWLNLNGNPGLATGGCGDVLTGLLGGLLAQGVSQETALPAAVALHGRAGDLAARRKSTAAMTAGDVVDALPAVLRHLQGR